MGRDHTVFALEAGYVRFWWHSLRRKYFIEVVKSHPAEEEVRKGRAGGRCVRVCLRGGRRASRVCAASAALGASSAADARPPARHPPAAHPPARPPLPTPTPRQVIKYPIVRLADWELAGLLKLDARTAVAPAIIARLTDWIRGLKARHQLAGVVPRGVPLVGGVEELAWGQRLGGGDEGRGATLGMPQAVPQAAPPSAGGASGAEAHS